MVVSGQDVLGKPLQGWRLRLYTIIFEADTRAGRLFDKALIGVILASVTVVVIDSMRGMGQTPRSIFLWLEWLFTLAFTVEYVARHPDVRGGRACQWLHQHSNVGVLGDHHDDNGRLWRHHTQDRPRPIDLIGHDAVGLGHAGGADRYRHRGDDGQAHRQHADHTHLPPYFSDASPARRQGD